MVPGIRVRDEERGLRSEGTLFGELFDSLRKCRHAKWEVRLVKVREFYFEVVIYTIMRGDGRQTHMAPRCATEA
jgi:hypothetical protein